MIEQLKDFAEQMQKELDTNSHKEDWRNWNNLGEMLWDLEYHKGKLLIAIKDNDKKLVKEYIADCANILMFMGNAGGLYRTEASSEKEMTCSCGKPSKIPLCKDCFDKGLKNV